MRATSFNRHARFWPARVLIRRSITLGWLQQRVIANEKYIKTDVNEQTLEDLIRQNAELIEEGLSYIDHQKQAAGGRLDMLFVDSGKSLVVAELKVVEDDGMLTQGVDYYDYVTSHIETYARLYSAHELDVNEQVRLLLIAPSFSQTLSTVRNGLTCPFRCSLTLVSKLRAIPT